MPYFHWWTTYCKLREHSWSTVSTIHHSRLWRMGHVSLNNQDIMIIVSPIAIKPAARYSGSTLLLYPMMTKRDRNPPYALPTSPNLTIVFLVSLGVKTMATLTRTSSNTKVLSTFMQPATQTTSRTLASAAPQSSTAPTTSKTVESTTPSAASTTRSEITMLPSRSVPTTGTSVLHTFPTVDLHGTATAQSVATTKTAGTTSQMVFVSLQQVGWVSE